MEGRTAFAACRLTHVSGAAGVDEAGRGPLAGPVVAAAVILPDDFDRSGIDDSKRLDPDVRDALAARIRQACPHAIALGDLEAIARLNILHATMAAMAEAVDALGGTPSCILIDGNRVPDPLRHRAEAVVQGDARLACIAAASIVAKTERDRIMAELGRAYPEYGFERHFGYATPEHLEAIQRHGPCPIHRMSFSPFAAQEQLCLALEA